MQNHLFDLFDTITNRGNGTVFTGSTALLCYQEVHLVASQITADTLLADQRLHHITTTSDDTWIDSISSLRQFF